MFLAEDDSGEDAETKKMMEQLSSTVVMERPNVRWYVLSPCCCMPIPLLAVNYITNRTTSVNFARAFHSSDVLAGMTWPVWRRPRG